MSLAFLINGFSLEIEAGPDQWLCSVKVWSGATFASFFASV